MFRLFFYYLQMSGFLTYYINVIKIYFCLDENRILDTLPQKLKTDVAINVHIKTLNKVQLFHDCDEALLRDLVLKLRPVLYLPGDYICRKVNIMNLEYRN